MTSGCFKAAACAFAAALAGCGISSSDGGVQVARALVPPAAASRSATATPSPGAFIKHVVIIIQENRSFDNLFEGFPGAASSAFGLTHTHKRVRLQPITFDGYDITHFYNNAVQDVDNGKMDGFDRNFISTGYRNTTWPYSYVNRTQVAPYWQMASEYTLLDRMFPTELGPSFTAHLDLIAGTTNLSRNVAEVDTPTEPGNSPYSWGCQAPKGTTSSIISATIPRANTNGPYPCFNEFHTLAETLDAAGVPWRFYAPSVDSPSGGYAWASFQAIKKVRWGPDWNNVLVPQTRVLTDAAAGALQGVTWVVPDQLDSDHPGARSPTGPSWVTAVVNAIGEGPQWDSTAIVVVWDDWGGWYDNVPPPQLTGPGQFVGLGIRVGCIVISPYAKHGYVDHTQYEFGSILHFIEDTFGLPFLGPTSAGYTDSRGASLTNAFDFTQAPAPFTPISAPYPPSYFIERPASHHAPDDY